MTKPFVLALVFICASILLCVVATVAGGNNPYYHFEEFRLMTWLNGVQLLLCAILSAGIFLVRRPIGAPAYFWLVAATGSVYLSLDEILSFHDYNGAIITFFKERLGLAIPEYAVVTDLFYLSYSDLILLAYGTLVAIVCLLFRAEFFKSARILIFFFTGSALLAGSIAIDFNVLMKLHHSLDLRGYNGGMLHAWEESLKYVGFSSIVSGLALRLYQDKNLAGKAAPGGAD